MAEQGKLASDLFKGRPYPPGAYKFVLKALEFSVRRLPERRHISGRELLAGIADYARQLYGPLSAEVFKSWGIKDTMDFGEIVFDLVKWNLLSRRDEDTKEDFRSTSDFSEAFENNYNYLCDFRVVRNGQYPHAVPLPQKEKGKDLGGGTHTVYLTDEP
jgi:uncharacterized repeat protein (TIGR04138 family)